MKSEFNNKKSFFQTLIKKVLTAWQKSEPSIKNIVLIKELLFILMLSVEWLSYLFRTFDWHVLYDLMPIIFW
jgi:hypothetical protein